MVIKFDHGNSRIFSHPCISFQKIRQSRLSNTVLLVEVPYHNQLRRSSDTRCAGLVFCASSQITNEFVKVSPRQ